VTGLTVSPVQAARAAEAAAGDPRLTFLCRDWMESGLEAASFDRAFSIESSEHMVDKARFFAEARRILRPGGRFGVYAWLAREEAAPWEVRHLLEPICREGRLPGMGTEAEYRALAEGAGLRVTGFEDLSARVARTWTICARRVAALVATDREARRFLLDPRSRNRVFALTLARLILAYRTGAMRYGILTLERP
jgi:tocopherol O-methyltransferase